ncbi:MAG: addiction module protein [Pirellulales bacterium]
MATVSEILNAAKGLTAQERAEVARALLLTLESAEFDEDIEQELAAMIRRRLKAIREGAVTLREWDDALADIRESIHPNGPA